MIATETRRRRSPRQPAHGSVETFSRGDLVPIVWAHDPAEREAIRAANGANLEAERNATIAVLVGVALLVLLGLVRLVVG